MAVPALKVYLSQAKNHHRNREPAGSLLYFHVFLPDDPQPADYHVRGFSTSTPVEDRIFAAFKAASRPA